MPEGLETAVTVEQWRTCLRCCSCHHSPIQMKTIVVALASSFWAAFLIHAGSDDGWMRKIDELAYALYGLTPEEIKIVEEASL